MVKRFINWCRTIVSRSLEWIEQQLMSQTKPSPATILAGAMGDAVRNREKLLLENALLRQQLVILKGSIKRVQPTNTERRILVWLTSRLKGWRKALLVVKPKTILVWHRTLFRLYWRHKSRVLVGRPRSSSDTVALIRRIAVDNRLWGAERIQGELLKVGIKLSKRTIQKYMRQAQPTPPSGQTWSTFLHNHAHQLWACDFLPIIGLFFRQFCAFFIVEIGSRRVVHVGVTATPTDA
jgi:putative transposase